MKFVSALFGPKVDFGDKELLMIVTGNVGRYASTNPPSADFTNTDTVK